MLQLQCVLAMSVVDQMQQQRIPMPVPAAELSFSLPFYWLTEAN